MPRRLVDQLRIGGGPMTEFPSDVLRYLTVDRVIPPAFIEHFGLYWDGLRQAIAIPIEGLVKYRSLRGFNPASGVGAPSLNKMFWGGRPEGHASEPWPPF